MKIERAAVIGAGAMGSGIAQVLSQAGISVVLKDIKSEFVERGCSNIKRMYDSRVAKGTLSQEEADKLFANVHPSTSYDDISSCDIVIEAALEEIDVKLEIFKKLDSICPEHTILASNTSALSISEIARATSRPGKVLGMHFFNPAQTMKLVEVIPGVHTDKQTVETAMDLCRTRLSKVPVQVKECPGFLVNRLLFPYMNEALWTLQEGKKSPDEIDAALIAFGMPMGPLALFDMTGIDICSHVVDFLYGEYGPRFEPAPLLRKMVERGQLGQKTGAGFYLHEGKPVKGQPKPVNPMLEELLAESRAELGNESKGWSGDFDAHRIILPMFNEAIYALQEEVVRPEDVETGMKFGCGMKDGLLSLAERNSLEWCLSELEKYQVSLKERFRPAWLLKKLARAGVKDFATRKELAACGS